MDTSTQLSWQLSAHGNPNAQQCNEDIKIKPASSYQADKLHTVHKVQVTTWPSRTPMSVAVEHAMTELCNRDELYLPNVIVIGVMARCDLQRSCPKLPIYISVSNDGNPPAELTAVIPMVAL